MSRTARIFWVGLRVGLGLVFVAASVHKILTPGAFAHEVHNYKLLPGALINPFAIVLPWLELVCGLALVVDRWTEGASLLVAILMAAFTAAVASAVLRGLNISCGCFKSGASAANELTVARDLALTAVAVLVMIRAWTRPKWNSPT